MTSTKTLIILGAGGNCVDIAESVARINQVSPTFELLGFLDDQAPTAESVIPKSSGSARSLTPRTILRPSLLMVSGAQEVFAKKAKIHNRLGIPDHQFATIVDPSVIVSPSATLEPGCVLLAQCFVGAGARIGAHCVVLPGCVISHHANLGRFATLASHVTISGRVRIEESVYLGAGCRIREDVCVASGTLVGMGAVVVKDCEASQTYIGTPARKQPT